jgi:ribosome-associated protein
MEPTDDLGPEKPSKSRRKREAHAAQALGQRLAQMREHELRGLPLDDTLLEALVEVRRIRSRCALARQYQYIGKLMRNADVAAIEAALAGREAAVRARARLR